MMMLVVVVVVVVVIIVLVFVVFCLYFPVQPPNHNCISLHCISNILCFSLYICVHRVHSGGTVLKA